MGNPPTYHLFPIRVRPRGFKFPICGLSANDSSGAGVAVGVAGAVVVAVESPPVWATAGLGATAAAKPITASAAKTASILVSIRVEPPGLKDCGEEFPPSRAEP